MTDMSGDNKQSDDFENVPVVSCTRCGREWELTYELDELQAGNRAVEQFALDHERHTGHLPDDISPWIADCENCPAGEQFLSKRPAKRWAVTHARHTYHSIDLISPDGDEKTITSDDSRYENSN
ncbi:hypothetical protein [Salinarchaeum sp. IM2453]|uniref:hypothetical protein n=1 Tax=Salinarchaeum sp. IM2453 TaxID=2862870 RepID=UPI0037CC8B1D